jgi:hypothetical protein
MDDLFHNNHNFSNFVYTDKIHKHPFIYGKQSARIHNNIKLTPRWRSNWYSCYLLTRCCFSWNESYDIITILCHPRNTSRTRAHKNRLLLVKVSITHNPSELQWIHAITQERQLSAGYRFHVQPSPTVIQHFYLRKDRSIKLFSE